MQAIGGKAQHFYHAMHFSAKCGLEIACRLSFCPSVCDAGGSWPHRLKIWKLIAQTISGTSSLSVAHQLPGNMEKFWRENVRSTPTSITSGWIESTESHVILGGGVAVCLVFTFVGTSRGHLCNSTAFLFHSTLVFSVQFRTTAWLTSACK